MTSDELSRVFVAFSQGDHAAGDGLHRFGGLGLGLTISRMLVQLHSGRFNATSDGRDRGTAFSIVLPLSPQATDAQSPPFSAAPWLRDTSTSSAPRPRCILLVKDHDATRNSLVGLLSRRGHRVVPAASVASALAGAETGPLDLVISDVGLPDGDGCDLMIELRERYALKGIAMTGYGMESDIARSRASGFIAHLTKPISIQDLESAIALIDLPGEK